MSSATRQCRPDTPKKTRNYCHQDIELERVVAHIRSHKNTVIAFSHGTDSSVVAALAKRAFGDATVAVTADNGALHHGEVEHAAAAYGTTAGPKSSTDQILAATRSKSQPSALQVGQF
jgi:GMP synthase PP-ATPase subunit